jgi:hypothetical protein
MASLKSYLAKLEACLGGLAPNAQQAVMEELRAWRTGRRRSGRLDWERRRA